MTKQTTTPRIVVGGDRYITGYLLPANSVKPGVNGIKTLKTDQANLYTLRGGADVVSDLLQGMQGQTPAVQHPPTPGTLKKEDPPDLKRSVSLGVYEVDKKRIADKNDDKFVFRAVEGSDAASSLLGEELDARRKPTRRTSSATPRHDDILVHWIARESIAREARKHCWQRQVGPRCAIHIQVGRWMRPEKRRNGAGTKVALTNESAQPADPSELARPLKARIVVTSLEEICPDARIRRALSYDSIAVDILRTWRGYGDRPLFTAQFRSLTGYKGRSGGFIKEHHRLQHGFHTIVRINNSALLYYSIMDDAGADEREEAWIFYHQERPAPMNTPGMGEMIGYNALMGAWIAHKAQSQFRPSSKKKFREWLGKALRECVVLQQEHFQRGFKEMLGIAEDWAAAPKVSPVASYGTSLTKFLASRGGMKAVGANVVSVKIRIATAVSHDIQWYVAHDRTLCPPRGDDKGAKAGPPKVEKLGGDELVQNRFRQYATSWLTKAGTDPKKDVTILEIEKLQLVDRREVEDFLSVREALLQYGNPDNRPGDVHPLNLAVFGSPGSGKSFGVKQVAAEVAKTMKIFAKDHLEYNLSQFASLADYASAFHEVRNECLKGTIPIVFFDEFDCSFEGKPLGWLKYFLAPMQDGRFSYGGSTFQLGACVLVFAGGVNRSYEEFSGRVRNPTFIEAKGPDFLSRLRDHLNIRGIDLGDDPGEAGLRLIRRALILRFHLRSRLCFKGSDSPPDHGLLHPALARAFCEIKGFRHGARSMEAILDMCHTVRGQTLGPSDLPSREQLDMHVDATKFLKIIYDDLGKGRGRQPSPG